MTTLLLASGGIPQAQIVLPEGASAAEEYAAEELRRHLCAIAGTGPYAWASSRARGADSGPVISLNDRTSAAEAGIDVAGLALGPEAFHLETRGNTLFVLGGSARGLLYGVYDLLESLGCRWFTPELTHIPYRPTCVLPPICKTSAPAFEFRDMFNWEGSDPIWWARNRMNGWYTSVPEYMGGQVGYGLFVHTFYTLLPPQEFFTEHPEYYSEIDGVRRHEQGQICLTNDDVLRLVTERVLERMRAYPRATIFSVSQNDWEGPCQCPRCAAVVAEEGSQSGPLIRFVNAIAEATVREFPDKLIDTLAYWYTLDAPRHAVPHRNVRVRLCSINCCQGHEYGTCDHKESARFLRALDDWGRLTKQMYIWHYCTNFRNYPLPMPDFDEIHDNIKLYQRRGVYGVFMQGMGEEGGGAESMALRAYVISKLLWNPDQPVWPLIDEFLAAYYGAAAPHAREYLDLFHARVREERTLHPSLYDRATSPLFDGDILPRAEATLAAGEQLVRGAERRRVRLLRNGLIFARLSRNATRFQLDGDSYRSEASPVERHAVAQLLRDYRRMGIRRLREGESFDATALQLNSRFAEHPVLWLRDGDDAVAIVPNLAGRLLEWHAHDRQWLAPPDLENNYIAYPMSEGYTEMVQTGAYTFFGNTERYRHRRNGNTIEVVADLACGLRLSRRYRLCDGVLSVESRLRNRGTAPVQVAWGAGLHLLVSGATTFVLTPEGVTSIPWSTLPDGLGAARILEGGHCPAGAWWADVDGYRVTVSFTGPITRAILGKIERTDTLALDLRTESHPLPPNEQVIVRQELRIEKRMKDEG